MGLALLLGACTTTREAVPTPAGGGEASATPAVQMTGAPAPDVENFSIGPSATDTIGGYLPDNQMLNPFDVANPVVGWLDPPLLTAVQNAARSAASDGIDLKITSGWRTKGFQQRLFDDAIRTYGDVGTAQQYVASPDTSRHVIGRAVDIGRTDADEWLMRNGSQFGLCQIFANEIWHFELAADKDGNCPPLRPNAAG
jgi:zinc D-Ala-D-Ala carboxypeptidase